MEILVIAQFGFETKPKYILRFGLAIITKEQLSAIWRKKCHSDRKSHDAAKLSNLQLHTFLIQNAGVGCLLSDSKGDEEMFGHSINTNK